MIGPCEESWATVKIIVAKVAERHQWMPSLGSSAHLNPAKASIRCSVLDRKVQVQIGTPDSISVSIAGSLSVAR